LGAGERVDEKTKTDYAQYRQYMAEFDERRLRQVPYD
jgi:hypothetical protein